jgi:hypothetical protein
MNEVMKELRPANPPSYEVTYELHNFYKPICILLVGAMLQVRLAKGRAESSHLHQHKWIHDI